MENIELRKQIVEQSKKTPVQLAAEMAEEDSMIIDQVGLTEHVIEDEAPEEVRD